MPIRPIDPNSLPRVRPAAVTQSPAPADLRPDVTPPARIRAAGPTDLPVTPDEAAKGATKHKKQVAASNLNPDGSYKVGKYKPPVDSQFKPGQSGNPRGPKKGTRTMKSLVEEIYFEKQDVRINGKTAKLDARGVVLSVLYAQAAKGNLKAVEGVLRVIREHGPQDEEQVLQITAAEQEEIERMLEAAGLPARPVVRRTVSENDIANNGDGVNDQDADGLDDELGS